MNVVRKSVTLRLCSGLATLERLMHAAVNAF